MNGLYRMFLGDARPNHSGDEWVFQDVDSIQEIIIPAARIALKVHQVREDGPGQLKRMIILFPPLLSPPSPSSFPPLLPPSSLPRIILHSQRSTRVPMESMKPFKM